jgi:hypothetical protein
LISLLLLATIYPLLHTSNDSAGLTRVPPPGVRTRMNMAMATSAPWIDSNLWKYRRNPNNSYISDLKGKSLIIAMAEAFAAGVPLALETTPDQEKEYQQVLSFLKQIPEGPAKPWVNWILKDEPSAQAAEVMNLMTRRNLLFRVDPKGDVSLAGVKNPYDFMQDLREKLGDEKRLLRLFGSELTVAALFRDGNRVRLHLLNYGTRPVENLRIRIVGKFNPSNIKARVYRDEAPKLKEFVQESGCTEFTLETLPSYAVLDLKE